MSVLISFSKTDDRWKLRYKDSSYELFFSDISQPWFSILNKSIEESIFEFFSGYILFEHGEEGYDLYNDMKELGVAQIKRIGV